MREYRKNDVLERLKAALEAGLYKARLLKSMGCLRIRRRGCWRGNGCTLNARG